MKKGFTMIELIFVIVILGILASVAIPRLAATREDAEISTTIANLRTLVSEASSYYVGHGKFTTGDTTNGVPWNEVTNVPLNNNTTRVVGTGTAPTAQLIVAGRENCIGVRLVNKNGATPAHILVTADGTGEYICKEIHKAEPVKAYLDSKLPGGKTAGVALGASARIYN